MVKIDALYESHLTVADLPRDVSFYRDVVGLDLAHEIPSRGVAFFWVGGRERSMLGVWSAGSAPVRVRSHVAFTVALDALVTAPAALRRHGVVPRCFGGNETDGPWVFPWMPAASVFFDDPNGNSLEYISILSQPARPDLTGTLPLADWLRLHG